MKNLSDEALKVVIEEALSGDMETDKVEFKDARGGIPEDIWKSITGFSNKPATGGVIVYGVVENRSTRAFDVVGVSNSHELVERTTNYINDLIVNADRPDYRYLSIRGEDMVAVVFDAIQDERKPCFNRRFGMDRGACIRDGNTDRPISDEELRSFIRNSTSFKQDLLPVRELLPSNLDTSKVEQLLTEVGARTGRTFGNPSPSPQNLIDMRITIREGEDTFPTLAGAMIFNNDEPQRSPSLSRYEVRCVRYSGATTASSIVDNQDVSGTLDKQIDNVQSFILRNIGHRAEIIGTTRRETYEYPELALREIVANSIIHRDYSITESYTQIRVFSDRIEVSNPGNLPPGVTVDNIREAQFSRNSVIAGLMRDMNYLEEYGRGIDLVFEYMRGEGLPRPIFRNVANLFTVTLLGPQFANLTERQLAIWQLILNQTRISARDISENIGSVSRPTIIADVNALITKGLVAPHGSGRNVTYELGTFQA